MCKPGDLPIIDRIGLKSAGENDKKYIAAEIRIMAFICDRANRENDTMRKNSSFSPRSFRPVVYGGLTEKNHCSSIRSLRLGHNFPLAVYSSPFSATKCVTTQKRYKLRRSGTRPRNTRPEFSSCNNLNYKFRLRRAPTIRRN